MSQDSPISLCLHQISGMYWIYEYMMEYVHPPVKPRSHQVSNDPHFSTAFTGLSSSSSAILLHKTWPKTIIDILWCISSKLGTNGRFQHISLDNPNSLWCRIKWRITIELKVVVGNYSQPCRLHLLFFPVSARRTPEKSQPGQPGQLRSLPMAVHPRHGRSASVVGRRFEPFKADRGQASQADVAKKRQRNGYKWIT